MAADSTIFRELAERTAGDFYLGVVGPVRTGKSTFIKRFMETLVIPQITDAYRQARARDELPQSAAGRTIMTAEPKFVPEEAVEIAPDSASHLSVRLIDSVGYLVPGAIGAEEDGTPRMVTTPWFPEPVPMAQAAELGTQKVMQTHCTLGILVTTDGTITDIPRADYAEAEARAIADMQATGKPFLILVNSREPEGAAAQTLRDALHERWGVTCLCVDALALGEGEIRAILRALLGEFPAREVRVFLPGWVEALETAHPLKQSLYAALRRAASRISRVCEARAALEELTQTEGVCACRIREIDLGTGCLSCEVRFDEGLFYRILRERTGLEIGSDGDLLRLLTELANARREYDRVASALAQVRATGYGIVMPDAEEMKLETPELVRRGGSYGIRLRASAPSIHMLRADIETEISPLVGDEKQSEDLIRYLLGTCEDSPERLWESNLFGRSLYELVSDGMNAKLRRMPEDARRKLTQTLTRILNEGSGGLICILL